MVIHLEAIPYGSYGSFYQQPFDYHPNFQNQGFCWQAPSNPNFQNQYDYAQYPPSAPVTSASQVNARHSQGSAQAAPASSATSSSTQASSTGSVNCSRVRWTEKETDALMSAWLEIHRDLKEHNKLKKNAVVWQQVTKEYNASAAVNKLNQKTVDQIKIKFRKLLDEYKETKVKMNRTGGASTTCPYFEEFDEIYGTKDSIVPRKISEAGLTLKENKDCNTEKLEWPCVSEDDLVSLASFGSTGSQTDDDISLSQAVLS